MLSLFYSLWGFHANEFPSLFQHGEWKDVEYVVSDGKFEGYLNGVQATKWSMGMSSVHVTYPSLLF